MVRKDSASSDEAAASMRSSRLRLATRSPSVPHSGCENTLTSATTAKIAPICAELNPADV